MFFVCIGQLSAPVVEHCRDLRAIVERREVVRECPIMGRSVRLLQRSGLNAGHDLIAGQSEGDGIGMQAYGEYEAVRANSRQCEDEAERE